jgi:hypothetical protein
MALAGTSRQSSWRANQPGDRLRWDSLGGMVASLTVPEYAIVVPVMPHSLLPT